MSEEAHDVVPRAGVELTVVVTPSGHGSPQRINAGTWYADPDGALRGLPDTDRLVAEGDADGAVKVMMLRKERRRLIAKVVGDIHGQLTRLFEVADQQEEQACKPRNAKSCPIVTG